jgi:hypothetical protein
MGATEPHGDGVAVPDGDAVAVPDGDGVAVPDGEGVAVPVDDVAVQATRWLADARIEEAARARSRQRWLRQQAEEGATFAGVLLTLAEAAAVVTVVLADGFAVEGTVVAVAGDYLTLTEPDRSTTYVALAAIAAVQPNDEGPRAASDARRVRSDHRLWQVVADAAGDRPLVTVRTVGASVTGVLTGVGADVLSVAGERPSTPVAYLPAGSVSLLSLRSSG